MNIVALDTDHSFDKLLHCRVWPSASHSCVLYNLVAYCGSLASAGVWLKVSELNAAPDTFQSVVWSWGLSEKLCPLYRGKNFTLAFSTLQLHIRVGHGFIFADPIQSDPQMSGIKSTRKLCATKYSNADF